MTLLTKIINRFNKLEYLPILTVKNVSETLLVSPWICKLFLEAGNRFGYFDICYVCQCRDCGYTYTRDYKFQFKTCESCGNSHFTKGTIFYIRSPK